MRRLTKILTIVFAMAIPVLLTAQEKKAEPVELPKLDYLKKGKVSIMQFSHQDLGWHAGSYNNEMKSVHRSLDKGMKLIEQDPRFKHDGELVIWLHDYVRLHPDKVDALKKQIQARRVQWGAGYTQPYTALLTSEQLARLMYLGRRWFKKTFDADTTLWYNTDVPGWTAQMPQILAKAGVDKAYLSRSWNIDGVRTDFLNWSAPDGSSVFCLMMNHYADYIHWRSGAPSIANDPVKMTKWLAEQEPEYKKRKILPVVPHLISKDNVGPRTDLLPMIDKWNEFAKDKELPAMIYDSMSDVIEKAKASPNADFKKLSGEWPNKWIYEAAPANYKMFTDNRAASRLLTSTEAFATFRAIHEGTWDNYPSDKLMDGWLAVDLSCHGVAPDSCVANFRDKYAGARKIGQEMLDETLAAIGSQVKTKAKRGTSPVVVFNNLSWTRTDLVQVPLPDGQKAGKIYDKDGKEVVCQSTASKTLFIAKDIPALGYSTFYLGKARKDDAGPVKPGAAWDKAYENNFFKVSPGKQGIAGIFDKELKRELLKTEKFEGAQWMDFAYKGQGAGEHTHIKLPEAAPLDKLGVFTTTWSCKESGPLFTTFESKEVQTERGKVSFQLRLYAQMKRIDLSCTMLECTTNEARQVRLAFPINADFKHVAYETPFGKVEVGKDEVQRQLAFKVERTAAEIEEFNKKLNKLTKGWQKKNLRRSFFGNAAVRPREIQNWIFAGNDTAGVTIGSSVIAWDYMDASQSPVDYPVLQPVMLCSAYSCSRWKHCWTQPGDHTFTFSIFSHAGGWQNGYRRGVAVNNPLIPVTIQPNKKGTLPASKSFLTVSADNIIVTAVKKSEDSDDVAIRFYETEGKEKTKVELTPAFKIKNARKTNLIEEDAGKMKHSSKAASMEVGKYSIETIRLVPGK